MPLNWICPSPFLQGGRDRNCYVSAEPLSIVLSSPREIGAVAVPFPPVGMNMPARHKLSLNTVLQRI